MAFHGACSFVSLTATFKLLDIVITNEVLKYGKQQNNHCLSTAI